MIRKISFKISEIIRHPNANKYNEMPTIDKFSSFKNSHVVLNDPVNQRELHLIGTLNCSDILAKRTEKLIQ